MSNNNISQVSATATVAVASPSPTLNKSIGHESLNYIFDVLLLLFVLYIIIFTKPQNTEKEEELTEEEKPNPLEQVLQTDPVDEKKPVDGNKPVDEKKGNE